MEIQINSAGLNFSWTTMATRKSKRLGFIQYCVGELKILWHNKHTIAFKPFPVFVGLNWEVAWALSINAIGIMIAFVHFNIMTLLTFVNVWRKTSLLYYVTTKIEWIIVFTRMNKLNITKSNTRNFDNTNVSYMKSKILCIKNRALTRIWSD